MKTFKEFLNESKSLKKRTLITTNAEITVNEIKVLRGELLEEKIIKNVISLFPDLVELWLTNKKDIQNSFKYIFGNKAKQLQIDDLIYSMTSVSTKENTGVFKVRIKNDFALIEFEFTITFKVF